MKNKIFRALAVLLVPVLLLAGCRKQKSAAADYEAAFFDTSVVHTVDVVLKAEDRPMWKWITDNEDYRDQYHEAYDTLLKDYFESGAFEKEFDAMYELLLPYVEKDPTAFYTVEEYKAGCEMLKRCCLVRAESIRRQLDGGLSTDSRTQKDQDKVDASDVDIAQIGASEF